jgi:hypothetical protein
VSATQAALLGTVAVYGLLALLLLSLNIFSLWRWWVKAGVMLLTAAVFLAAYTVISGLIGWPSESQLPPRFSLIGTHVDEPDQQNNKPGHIYLWLQEIDEHQLPVAAPRAYSMPYTVATMKGVTKSQEMLDRGESVLGESKTQVTASGDKPGDGGSNADDLTAERGEVNMSNGGTKNTNAAGSIFGFPGGQAVNFSAMPSVDLPKKQL